MPSTGIERELPWSDWYAVNVRSGREQSCADHLTARGYHVFLPYGTERRKWSDRVKVIRMALFPGYVFCRMPPRLSGTIVSTPGVIRIVGTNDGPTPIAVEEIAAVQQIVASGIAAEPWRFIQEGQRVRLDDGPLRGVTGLVVRADSGKRLVVSVSMLRRCVAVEVDPRWAFVIQEDDSACYDAVGDVIRP